MEHSLAERVHVFLGRAFADLSREEVHVRFGPDIQSYIVRLGAPQGHSHNFSQIADGSVIFLFGLG